MLGYNNPSHPEHTLIELLDTAGAQLSTGWTLTYFSES